MSGSSSPASGTVKASVLLMTTVRAVSLTARTQVSALINSQTPALPDLRTAAGVHTACHWKQKSVLRHGEGLCAGHDHHRCCVSHCTNTQKLSCAVYSQNSLSGSFVQGNSSQAHTLPLHDTLHSLARSG